MNDSDSINTLVRALQKDGHTVFYAGGCDNKFVAGWNWMEYFGNSIKESEIFIAVVTENFLSSSSAAIELGAVMTTQSTHTILPIIVGDVRPPFDLIHLRYLKVDTIKDGIEAIVVALDELGKRLISDKQQIGNQTITETEYFDETIASLHNALSDNRLTLVCGAGISKTSKIPAWDTLLANILSNASNELYEVIGNSSQNINSKELLDKLPKSNLIIARTLQSILKDKFSERVRESLYAERKKLEEYYDSYMAYDLSVHYPLSDIMKSIVALARPKRTGKRLDSIITLNFDDIIEQSLAAPGIDFCSIWKEGQIAEAEKLPIYHVHGYLPMRGALDNPNLVFGEESYHTQYADPFAWSNLIQLITFSSNICLFVGLSLNDPNIRRLLDYSQRKNPSKRHFIFYKALSQNDTDKTANRLIENDAQNLGLSVIWINHYEQIPDLLNRILK
jgi:hypothetical protein